MADVVKKMVRAVIDRRTTMVCLHAAGQVQPVDEPFVTLAGSYMTPPFHVHCRSTSVPWMAGFEDEIRSQANAEILTRPKKPIRIPPPPKDPPSAGTLGAGRTRPPGMPGGGARLEDVPPAQRRDWIMAHPERFEVSVNGGGISETHWVRDTGTGARYVLKKGQYHAESMNEIVGTRVDGQIGLKGRALIADTMEDGNGYLLLDHAEDVMPGYRVVGTGGSHAAMSRLAGRLEDQADAVRVLLGDFVRDEADAKGGNMLLLSKDGGRTVRMVPIDRSLGMMGWRDAIEPGKVSTVTGDWSLAGRLKVTDLRAYMKTRGSPKGVLEMVQGMAQSAAGRQAIRDAYDDVLDRLERMDLDEMFDGFVGTDADEARALVEDRIALLRSRRDLILRQMGVE